MARLIMPLDFYSQKELADNVASKHNSDGKSSIIGGFLQDNNIDPTKFAGKAAIAKSHYDTKSLLFEQSTKYTQLRDVAMQLPTKNLKNLVQVLKKHYRAAPTKLADWGINVVGGNKISYPTAFTDMANVILKFNDTHIKMTAGTSPLDSFIAENEIDLVKDNSKVQEALQYHSDANKKAEEAAKETQLFNTIWQPVVKDLAAIGNYLLGIFVKSARKAADWGFAIDDNPTPAKEVNTKIKLGDQVTLKGVVIGGTLKNNGTTDLHLYKGTTTKGDPIIVKPGESYGITKGFSIITISNPDTTTEAKLSVLRIN